jgi:histidinol phosphatase-like enzyme
MLLRARDELMVTLEDSYIIGDTLKDIEAGAKVGVKGVLVRTGYGSEAAARLADQASKPEDAIRYRPLRVATDITEAVRWIIMNQDKKGAP